MIPRDSNYYLSGDDMLQVLDGKCNLMTYRELNNCTSINQVLGPHQCAVILYETQAKLGHWVCCWRQRNGDIFFFDSYDGAPDTQLQYVSDTYRLTDVPRKGKTGGHKYWVPHLVSLLLKAREGGAGVDYNDYAFQRHGSSIATCGRWVLNRLQHREMSSDDYARHVVAACKREKMSPDQWVTDGSETVSKGV